MIDYKNLIMERKSVREFEEREIEQKQKETLQGFFNDCERLSDDIKTEIKLVSNHGASKKCGDAAGYNGFMIDAPAYLMILSENAPYSTENAGYMGQDLILKAQSIGIDSCWITIRDAEKVKNVFLIDSPLEVTALIAIGYGSKTNSAKNSTATDNDIRRELEEIVYKGSWGEPITFEEIENSGFLEAFQGARWAPSALNRQPCRFILDNDAVILLVQDDAYNNTYELKIAAGVAMMNFAAVVTSSLFALKWMPSVIGRDYKIPPDSTMIAYCKI